MDLSLDPETAIVRGLNPKEDSANEPFFICSSELLYSTVRTKSL